MSDTTARKRSNRPSSFVAESKFIQQRLPVINPVLDTTTVLPTLLFISLIFIPLGIGIWIFASNIITEDRKNRTDQCHEMFKKCYCTLPVPELLKGLNGTDIHMFYALTNFNQNHMDYYDSKDEYQLSGQLGTIEKPREPPAKCRPYHRINNPGHPNHNKIIYPCGAIANTMFNDRIQLFHNDSVLYPEEPEEVKLISTGIAWERYRTKKYKNPEMFRNPKNPIWLHFTKPCGWTNWVWSLDPTNRSNNGMQNEDFINWMRVAAFPDFRKLYRIVNSSVETYEKGLPPGNYHFHIEYNYHVTNINATKSVILSTTTMVAGKNPFLGVAFMSVGGICLFFAIVFFIIRLRTGTIMWIV